ncbi:pyruvate dehydrogenase E2 component (dihydrolipoamide acetyltransferase) [Lishizhenia tianjinensis]|uniref:Acetyltransferase component of pyruvate dehydrogenase complex n=1 Tax=Lishizhenia tianjinensis TaxID=477690 RepID=A0A1I7APM0_9FLAO|nr:pyruvate dehydrogenase complex dihydrolipoamide acetyltransferase [Lishizhenia tianjinensis]SFT76857.1 pyruvate dehydrogenase E2 component (dihydrolipoamide acetyltransferase) [Lishizhenia tianjinensis]
MAEVILMPKLSDTMTEGVVAEWHIKVGEEVSSGDLLAEIETDKATMEFESFYDGVLLHIGVEKGATAPVNDVLAIIGEKGENVEEILANAGAAAPAAAPETEEKKEETPVAAPAPAAEKPAPAATPAPQPAAAPVASPNGDRIFASPLAKKLAEDKGIDIALVKGTGENGRIVKRDVEHYVPYVPAAGSAAPVRTAVAGQESYTDENVSQMRKTIARRLAESKFTAPHFYITMDIDMDNAMAARKAINAQEGVKVSFNDMVIKAVSMSLRKHPAINSAWMGDFIRRNEHIHIGVAVAVDEGLLVPVIRFADSKGMSEIGAEVKQLAQAAKDKKLQPKDWEGNTFTISNLGMFGVEEFTAIVNPPDSCILAVGGIKQVPVVKNGAVVPGNVMKVTLSCDHRVVDGASGAAFLNTFKQYMENPVMMLV